MKFLWFGNLKNITSEGSRLSRTHVTEGLKNLALAHRVPIVAVAASDEEGLKNERVRFQDLRGGSRVQYEPDVALMLNRRSDAKVTFSVDKNRLGPAMQEFSLSLSGETYSFEV